MLKQMSAKHLDLVDFSHNAITDIGADTLVDFLIENQKPVKKLKLFGNRLETCDALIRLLEDPGCGLQSDTTIQELHVSHNELEASAIEDLLSCIARLKCIAGPLSPPLWLQVEGNKFGEEEMSEVAQRLQGELGICVVAGSSGTVPDFCEDGSDVDVHLVLEDVEIQEEV